MIKPEVLANCNIVIIIRVLADFPHGPVMQDQTADLTPVA